MGLKKKLKQQPGGLEQEIHLAGLPETSLYSFGASVNSLIYCGIESISYQIFSLQYIGMVNIEE